MNHFELFELPVSILLDRKELKRRFYQKSRDFHPDFYTLESDSKKEEILNYSTQINEAYRILNDFDLRLRYILELHDRYQEEGTNKIETSFLMEMMEINEMLMEMEFSPDSSVKEKIVHLIQEKEEGLTKEVRQLFSKNPEVYTDQEWEQITSFYFKRRYLWRLRQNLNQAG